MEGPYKKMFLTLLHVIRKCHYYDTERRERCAEIKDLKLRKKSQQNDFSQYDDKVRLAEVCNVLQQKV